ncbi:MAG: fibronectin type III domain-containing protein [Sedimentisphaerales bacterium]
MNLSWTAGSTAASHDVYLGDDYQTVAEASPDSDVFRGNQTATSYIAGFPGYAYPDGLVPGTTYYWRIDEVEADGMTKHKGDVWSFSIPPKTAYDPAPADGAGFVGPDNVTLRWTPGFGAKLHTVYFGDDFDALSSATGGVSTAPASYKPGSLQGEKVYYWRVDEFDGVGTYKGDVWSFTTPGAVANPQPAYGAADVQMNVILSWSPADSAASHQLYFGTDKGAVRDADAGSPEYKGSRALGAESYDPSLLDADTTYYWRVDEVEAPGNVSTGPLWIFTTGAFLLVDDFERYTDDDAAGQAIWQTWIDGFGIPDNGAQVGYLVPPYCEQTIVHGGSQSMPLLYANEGGVTNSEASLTLTAPRNWTQAGVAELSLWLQGASGNAAEPLYVVVSNSAGTPAIVAYEDSDAATKTFWEQWRISLQAFSDRGINLANVDKIAIGLGSKADMAVVGGSGTMYIDDIRLSQP